MKSLEIRAMENRPPTVTDRVVRGYAALFNVVSRVVSERGRAFREVLLPGAFTRSLANPPLGDIVALWEHGFDGRPPLGRTSAGTLRLWEDPVGLAYELTLPESAGDIREAIGRGDIRGNSIGFNKAVARWYHREGFQHRDVSTLDLVEMSFVTHPAYPGAGIEQRSYTEVPDVHPLNLAQVRIQLAEADR